MVALPHSRRFLASFLHECDFCIGGMPMEMVSSYCRLGHLVTTGISRGSYVISCLLFVKIDFSLNLA